MNKRLGSFRERKKINRFLHERKKERFKIIQTNLFFFILKKAVDRKKSYKTAE